MAESTGHAEFDLREFVATSLGSRIDDSAPLSASDLRLLLSKLHGRSDQLKIRLRKIVAENHDQFNSIVKDAHGAAAGVEALAEDVEKVVDALEEDRKGEPPFDVGICRLAATAEELWEEQEERKEYIGALEFIASVREGLKSAERDFHLGALAESGTKLCRIREQLELPADWTGDRDDKKERQMKEDEVQAFVLLQDEWATCYSKLRNFLEELFAKAVVLNLHGSELCIYSRVSCSDMMAGVNADEVELATILSTMDKVGVLETRLAKTADLLLKHIIDPIVRSPRFAVHVNDMDQEGRAILNWMQSCSKTNGGGYVEMFAKLLEVFKYLRTNLLVDNDGWMVLLGRVIWPELAEAITANCLRKAVPNEISELASFQELAQASAEFETCLGKACLIPDWNETRGDKLRSFSADVEHHFGAKKRNSVMAKARDLLIKFDYRSNLINREEKTIQGVDDSDNISLLQTETCTITLAAKQLLELVHDTLQDACKSSPSIAMELYLGARDALHLHRAIIPVKAMEYLNSIHKAASLCYNDCFYIAHHVLFLHFQYYPALPRNVQKIMSFVDFAPLFRRFGCQILEKQMHLITVKLMEDLDQANGFQYLEQRKRYDTCTNAIGKLRKLMLDAMAGLSTLFASANEDSDEAGGDCAKDSVQRRVPLWRKLLRLTDLLDMSLRPITQSWENGDLPSSGFSADEVQHLIKAIFSETDLRSECLKVIVDSRSK
ncbi:centromere/kinetochore protein zw10 homolog isoform X2 [Physcomitrium patens]|uniref:Centromere/kinetochore protein zw10-like protein n=1 Tax=Physcomitrium patens TaxID=3218 RepID=A0A7I4DGG5_PHYPA|nr:centromere/kinetochore protein zw10 homolog isoform X2 [Physcomitrium patens]|eukprot:XP_024370884.1 centromere/kinetochore protein zw10 homolog isoform X2 [Physcomitrella patens]